MIACYITLHNLFSSIILLSFQFQTHFSQNYPLEITPISHIHINQIYIAYIQRIKNNASAEIFSSKKNNNNNNNIYYLYTILLSFVLKYYD